MVFTGQRTTEGNTIKRYNYMYVYSAKYNNVCHFNVISAIVRLMYDNCSELPGTEVTSSPNQPAVPYMGYTYPPGDQLRLNPGLVLKVQDTSL